MAIIAMKRFLAAQTSSSRKLPTLPPSTLSRVYGTVQIRRSERGAYFGMPDQNFPKTPEPSIPESRTTENATPAPAIQVNGPRGPAPGAPLQESELMQPSATPSPIPTPLSPTPEENPQRLPYWLQQSEKFLRVVVRMYLGLLVCCAPWYPPAWDANPLFSSSPGLTAFISSGAVKGVVSGLGLLNLWIALRDAVRSSDS